MNRQTEVSPCMKKPIKKSSIRKLLKIFYKLTSLIDICHQTWLPLGLVSALVICKLLEELDVFFWDKMSLRRPGVFKQWLFAQPNPFSCSVMKNMFKPNNGSAVFGSVDFY